MHPAVKVALASWLAYAAALPAAGVAAAAAGALDPDFSAGHVVTTPDPQGGYMEGHAVAVQPDGHIVVAGQSCTAPSQGCAIAVERLDSDGSLDDTFNSGGPQPGVVTVPIGGNDSHADGVAVTAEGRILVAGYTCAAVDQCAVLVTRLLPDGSIDTTFGNQGFITQSYGATAQAASFALQPDGKMVMAGYSNAGSGANDDFAVIRYNANNADLSFNGSGGVVIDFNATDDRINAVALQPDGKIVVAGQSCQLNSFVCNFAVARFNADGTLDSNFNAADPHAGTVTTAVVSGGDNEAQAVTIQPDGMIVVAGTACPVSRNTCTFAVVRYTGDGLLDVQSGTHQGFNGTGIATASVSGKLDVADAVAVQPDGKIVAAGYANGGSGNDLALVRFKPDGTPDGTFGPGGVKTVDVSGGGDEIYAVAVQPDSRIVAAGATGTGSGSSLVVARFIADVTPWNLVPDAFIFGTIHGVPAGSVQTSNLITVQGLAPDIAVPVTVLNGNYAKNGSTTYTNAPGWAQDGDEFNVQQVASSLSGQSYSTALLIGGVATPTNPALPVGPTASATFTTTTALTAPTGGGGGGGDGPLSYAGLALLAMARWFLSATGRGGRARRRKTAP